MPIITFYYDIVCPFAYIASQRIEALAEQRGATIEWRPILLGGLYQHHKNDQQPSQKWAESKVRHNIRQLTQEAERYNITLKYNINHPQRTVEALRLLLCCSEESRPAVTHELFKAYWVDGINFKESDILDDIAQRYNMEFKCYTKQHIKDLLLKRTTEAAKSGVFGVPTFEYNGQRWWGQDRMHFLNIALGGNVSSVFASTSEPKPLTFYHDFSSPYSYLAFKQMKRFSDESNHSIKVKPILLGALFKAIKTPMVPILVMSKAKQIYLIKDLNDWADFWDTPFKFPRTFPLRSVLPLRISIVNPALTDKLYHAFWVDGIDISQPVEVQSIIENEGLDAKDILAKANSKEIKDVLRKNTQNAIDTGVCGVPSLVLDGETWWGQDRLLAVAEYLANP